ncbi:p-hydroxyphenylacetate 3-hydroxylase, reductase component [compost metagenome]
MSLDPPLVLWSIGKSNYSYPAFARAGHFAVHVLDAGQRPLSDRFAQAATDKFAGLDVGCGLGEVPLLPGCLAVFECGTEHRYEGGDHLILVGRVLRMDVARSATQPLLFHRGRYAELVCPETV